MSVRSPEYPSSFVSSSPKFPTLREYDVLNKPGVGGEYQPNTDFNNTEVIARPIDRNLPPTESQIKESQPIDLALIIDTNPIPRWDMDLETKRLVNNINIGLSEGATLAEAVRKSAEELEINIRAFGLEIIKSRAVLPHVNRFESKDRVMRMVGNNGQPLIDGVSAQERRGSVLEASRFIDKTLPAAPNNTFAVLMSPLGWNGFVDQNGVEAQPHLNTQTLIFWKDPIGQLKGLTLHNDLKPEQAEEVMVSLEVSRQDLAGQTQQDKLVSIVKNPAFLSLPQSYANPFEYVLDKILAIRGNGHIRLTQQDGSIEIRPISQIRAEIGKFDKLLEGSLTEENLIAELRNFVLSKTEQIREAEAQRQIVDKIRQTILSLTRIYLQDTNQVSWYQPQAQMEQTYRRDVALDDSFRPEIAYLKTRAGCPVSLGGSIRSLSGISVGSGGISVGGIFGGEAGKKGKSCISCGEVNYCTKECYKCGGTLI